MNPSIEIKLIYLFTIYHCYVTLFIFLTKILFEDCLHCIAFLNQLTLLNDENKTKDEYMKSWEKDKMVDNKTILKI